MFIKYPSIDNHYQEKIITWWLDRYPELYNEIFVLEEKLHGFNTQVIVTSEGEYRFASRNHLIGDEMQGVNFRHMFVSGDYSYSVDFLKRVRNWACIECRQVNLYGETVGKGIQKGVDYGTDKIFKLFDVRLNGVLLSPYDRMLWINQLYPEGQTSEDYSRLVVPFVNLVTGLDAVLKYNTCFDSKLTPENHIGPNICEGVVVKPLRTVYLDGNGSPFYLKIKNDEFKEKSREKKIVIDDTDPIVLQWHNEFLSYITDARVDAVESKEVKKLEKPSQFGDYIRLVMEDAKSDFLKDNPEYNGDKKMDKIVFNAGSQIVALLKKRV